MTDTAREAGDARAAGQHATGDAALCVPCPQCSAPPGPPCFWRDRGKTVSHRPRIEAGYAAAADVRQLPPPWPTDDTFTLFCQWCGQEINKERPGHAAVDRAEAIRRTLELARSGAHGGA